jgi:hypothetical protein
MSLQVLACLALSSVLFNQALGQSGVKYGPMSTRQSQIVFPPVDGPCPQNVGQTPCEFLAEDFSKMQNMLTVFQTLAMRQTVWIFLHQAFATYKLSKAFRCVVAALTMRFSVPHAVAMQEGE